ncbi:Sec-independent protein translocase protein TatB [Sphingomonas sp. HF-S4]|uniref:Sec-independent protein translocase protein TatB n=1 Tax=Sphingomonas agrestis TaxID=3080540 RepID=A0ABU3Y798_9SPHN|nr:Sec-independent protein translocase protein TatB [Sphingomonas sp. HF-S4]MDV3457281.1 Sec-independent protein translocase protein TatB [Sphingomonas sp. HF-S4]
MLDVAPTELLLVAVVALLVIGPKDLPKAMRFVGKWVGKARGVARQFRSGFDAMVRESELAEMEKQWAAENERIMREHPPTPALPAPEADLGGHDATASDASMAEAAFHDPADAAPVMVEQPVLFPGDAEAPAPAKPKRVRKPKPASSDEPQS